IEGLRRAVGEASLPVLAIGGIDARRARECARAGAAGVAGIGAFFSSEDPEAAARSLLGAFEEGRK
ncbi:MAG: thiamine phosphate synthase, partial [Planctomycetota bacterium]